MASFIPEMRQKIADTLEIELDRINIKATTEEGLGFTGEGLGIACQSIALLETIDNYIYRDVATGIIDEVEGRALTDVDKEKAVAEMLRENRRGING
jgi:2-C-methyl-D-erythritol 2,4-cyclodiphosphate synthase